MTFFLDIIPPTATAQEKKISMVNGRPIVYKSQGARDAEELLTLALKKHRPKEPIRCAVSLCTIWYFQKGRHRIGYKTTRPDTDNLQKGLKDIMTRLGFWADDALVASDHCVKYWSDKPGIKISIEELEGEDG